MAKTPGADQLITAEDLLYMAIPAKQTELVRGTLIVREPPGFRHGRIGLAIAARLSEYVGARGLGVVVVEAGFKLFSDPDTVRGPDAAFIARDRVPFPEPIGYLAIAPDLVVEVLSPRARPGEVLSTVSDWLTAGTRLVWVIDPARRRAVAYGADGSIALLGETDALSGEDVVTGFSCPLAEIL